MNPLISVIVPVYRVEPFLPRCLDSLRNQTYRNLEILLVDDGSPDNCGKICDEYAEKDHRFRVIHKENGGLSSARNAGLDAATGEFIGFVDSDDWIAPQMYETLLSALIKWVPSLPAAAATMSGRKPASRKSACAPKATSAFPAWPSRAEFFATMAVIPVPATSCTVGSCWRECVTRKGGSARICR